MAYYDAKRNPWRRLIGEDVVECCMLGECRGHGSEVKCTMGYQDLSETFLMHAQPESGRRFSQEPAETSIDTCLKVLKADSARSKDQYRSCGLALRF
jgi:hypothetical protein